MPADYELVGGRSGFKRYSHPELRRLRAERDAADEAKEAAAAGILQRLVCRVVEHADVYRRAVAAVAQLDVLGSLALAAKQADGVMCVPTFAGTERDVKKGLVKCVITPPFHMWHMSVCVQVAYECV